MSYLITKFQLAKNIENRVKLAQIILTNYGHELSAIEHKFFNQYLLMFK